MYIVAINFIKLARPKHYLKNVFVFVPLFFSEFFYLKLLENAAIAFVVFCLLSSSIYSLNDVMDCNSDKLHPKKKNRPIASGAISEIQGIIFSITLSLIAFGVALLLLPLSFVLICVFYYFNNLVYSLILKKKTIADVMSISFGFLIRILGGGYATGIFLSEWLITCGFWLCLFLGFSKRYLELSRSNPAEFRSVLAIYDKDKLDKLLSITAAICILAYTIYCISPHTKVIHSGSNLLLTVPFVVYGMFRFIFKIHEAKTDDLVDLITSDKVLLLNALIWVLLFRLIIKYHFKIF